MWGFELYVPCDQERAVYEKSMPKLKRLLPSLGVRGEFTLTLLAIRAFDRASGHNPSRLIPLQDFLNELLGSSGMRLIDHPEVKKSQRFFGQQKKRSKTNESEPIPSRFLTLTQFIKIEIRNEEVTKEYIMRLATRGLGVVMGERNAGYDLLNL